MTTAYVIMRVYRGPTHTTTYTGNTIHCTTHVVSPMFTKHDTHTVISKESVFSKVEALLKVRA